MLKQLSISNYALIDKLEINLYDGLSIITGETGAGKSIILGALSLLLGQRADSKSIRNAEKKTVIEAVFDIRDYGLESVFETNDIDYAEECIMRREILPNGRTRAFINDMPVVLSIMEDVATRLIDIHSQHSNAQLLNPAYQLNVIDGLSDNSELLEEYRKAYRSYSDLKRQLVETKKRIAKNKDDEEYFRFQYTQIASLKLEAGEQETLEKSRMSLSNVADIKEKLWDSANLLGGDERSAISYLSSVAHKLGSISGVYDEAGQLSERVDSALIEIKDVYSTIDDCLDNLADDPLELERIETRLNSIYSLQQKYHVGSVEELLKIQSDLERSLQEIDNSDGEINELQKRLSDAEKIVASLAEDLSQQRRKTAAAFERRLSGIAIPLGMKNFSCKVDFSPIPYDKNGKDSIRFLFSFNKNQELMPVEKAASGGEISRLMLCIKSIIAEKMQLPSIIFDEVDTGVSGEVANKIGEMMKRISDRIQVITITHLPQVAALGNHHYKVYKKDEGDSTVTNIIELDEDKRIREIAGMLSGSTINDAAMNNAKSLLNLN